MREFGEQIRAKKPSGCLKYFLYAGCATFTVIVAWFVLGFVAIVMAILPPDPPSGWETRILPRQIGTSRVLYKEHWAIWRDKCEFVAYELAESTVLAIDKRRFAFFADATPPPESRNSSPYVKWRQTPVEDSAPENSRLFATGASQGCTQSHEKARLSEELSTIVSRIHETGGYYTVTRNGYGMIVVLPEVGIVLFLYST